MPSGPSLPPANKKQDVSFKIKTKYVEWNADVDSILLGYVDYVNNKGTPVSHAFFAVKVFILFASFISSHSPKFGSLFCSLSFNFYNLS